MRYLNSDLVTSDQSRSAKFLSNPGPPAGGTGESERSAGRIISNLKVMKNLVGYLGYVCKIFGPPVIVKQN